MNLNPDGHHRYALERQQRLLGDAAPHRLAPTPARTRTAWRLRRTADRLDAAFPCGPVDRALAERG